MSFLAPLFAVTLIDTRTGRPHRVAGSVMTLFTRDPDEAEQELLRDRDRGLWKVEVRGFGPELRA
jgi:hypothetical protein